MTPFERSWVKLKLAEKGYSLHPKDLGGPTKYGITEMVARANDYQGDMRDLDEETAKRIAKAQYWDRLCLDQIHELAGEEIAHEMLDSGYNMGTGIVGRFLQRLLNALNREGRDYPDLEVDGGVGPVTVDRLRDFIRRRGDDGRVVLFRGLNGLQLGRYLEITEKRPANEEFLFGWILHRVS